MQPVLKYGVDPDAELDLWSEDLRFGGVLHPGLHLSEGGELLFDVCEVALVGRLPVDWVQQRGEEEA